MATKELTLAQVTALVRLTQRVDNLNTIHSGKGAPAASLGTDGDWYIDTDSLTIYGPKASDWGDGIELATRTEISQLTVGGNLGGSGSGSAATISVGTTTTGDAGTDASVTNVGTSEAAVFNGVKVPLLECALAEVVCHKVLASIVLCLLGLMV